MAKVEPILMTPNAAASPASRFLLYASCVARDEVGVLLLGPSASGKSDMVLRLLDRGFVLVSDDQVQVWDERRAGPPPALAGLLEVRGLGIIGVPFRSDVALCLAVRLEAPSARLPACDERFTLPTGVTLPIVVIDPKSASAPIRTALALDWAIGAIHLVHGASVGIGPGSDV